MGTISQKSTSLIYDGKYTSGSVAKKAQIQQILLSRTCDRYQGIIEILRDEINRLNEENLSLKDVISEDNDLKANHQN